MSTPSITHRFVSKNNSNKTCDLTIYINEVNNNYRIDYTYNYSHDAPLRELNYAHPLYDEPKLANSYSLGVSVTKNAVTISLTEFLKMTDDELAQHTGTLTPMEYRRIILSTLARLCVY